MPCLSVEIVELEAKGGTRPTMIHSMAPGPTSPASCGVRVRDGRV